RFSDVNAWGGGLGGCFDPVTGAHYAAWVYPEGSPAGANVLTVFKFSNYTAYQVMGQVNLPPVGNNAHTLMLSLRGNEVIVYYDGVQRIAVTDASVNPLTSGGICVDMYTDLAPYTFFVDDVQVSSKIAAVTLANLSQVYNGTSRVPSITTLPGGLTVNLT